MISEVRKDRLSDWQLGLVVFAIFGTALALDWRLSPFPEPYMVPKFLTLGLSAACAGLLLASRGADPVRPRWVDLALAAYLAVSLLSFGTQRRNPTWALELFAFETGALLLAITTSGALRGDPVRRERIFSVLLWAATVVCLIGFAEALGVSFPWEEARRPQSTLGNRNAVACYAGIVLPLAFGRFARKPAWAAAVPVAILTAMVAVTRCRSVWLGLACVGGLALTAWLALGLPPAIRGRNVRGAMLIVGLAAVGGGLVPWPGLHWKEASPFWSTLTRVGAVDEGSGLVRLEEYRLATSMLRDHPLLGVGPRGWDDAVAEVSPKLGLAATPWCGRNVPMSDALRIVSETGLLGFAAFLAALGLLARGAFRAAKAGAVGIWAPLGSLGVAGIHALADMPMARLCSLTLIAVLLGTLRDATPPLSSSLPGRPIRWLAAVVGVGVLGVAVLRARAAYTLASGPYGSVATMLEAQRAFPLTNVSQLLVQALARDGRCAEIGPHVIRALQWSPHHWGPLEVAASCADRSGDATTAGIFRQALQDPNVDFLKTFLSYWR